MYPGLNPLTFRRDSKLFFFWKCPTNNSIVENSKPLMDLTIYHLRRASYFVESTFRLPLAEFVKILMVLSLTTLPKSFTRRKARLTIYIIWVICME